jgi:hypothetical protein
MRFGEYLVRTGLATGTDILMTLAEQDRRRTFIPRLVVELGVVTLPDAMNLWDESLDEEHCEDFLTFLVSRGVLTKVAAIHARNQWMRSAPPLGLLLVELNVLQEDERYHALAAFTELKRNGLVPQPTTNHAAPQQTVDRTLARRG